SERAFIYRASTKDILDDHATPIPTGATKIAQPVAPYLDVKIPLCHVLLRPPSLNDCMISNASEMSGHLLVHVYFEVDIPAFGTVRYMISKREFFARASQLTQDEMLPIVFLAGRLPTEIEFEYLCVFPLVSYMVGDPRRKRDLINAGIMGASKGELSLFKVL
ncbi:hypothetical protein HDV05_001834, partial [Chytridiales sp. JEL 0842]